MEGRLSGLRFLETGKAKQHHESRGVDDMVLNLRWSFVRCQNVLLVHAGKIDTLNRTEINIYV